MDKEDTFTSTPRPRMNPTQKGLEQFEQETKLDFMGQFPYKSCRRRTTSGMNTKFCHSKNSTANDCTVHLVETPLKSRERELGLITRKSFAEIPKGDSLIQWRQKVKKPKSVTEVKRGNLS